MFGIQHFPVFVASGILLNLTPGPDTLYILGRSLAQGRRAGVLSVLGIGTGCVAHTVAAAFGISAILAASASAFATVRWLGAVYLVWLGISMLVGRRELAEPDGAALPRAGTWAIYRQGVLTNLLNPKVVLFYMAFLPQFVEPSSNAKPMAFLVLGGSFLTTGMLWCLALAWFAGAVGRRLRQHPGAGTWLNRAAGGLFLGLGAKMAVGR